MQSTHPQLWGVAENAGRHLQSQLHVFGSSHRGFHASSQHSAVRRVRRTDALDRLVRKFALRFPSSTDAGISIHAESAGQSREFARDLATTIACSGVSAVTRHVPTASTDPARDEKSVTRNIMACPLGSEGLTSLRLLPG